MPDTEGEEDLSKEEGMVANWRQARSKTAIGFILVAILLYGCAGGQVESGGQPLANSGDRRIHADHGRI